MITKKLFSKVLTMSKAQVAGTARKPAWNAQGWTWTCVAAIRQDLLSPSAKAGLGPLPELDRACRSKVEDAQRASSLRISNKESSFHPFQDQGEAIAILRPNHAPVYVAPTLWAMLGPCKAILTDGPFDPVIGADENGEPMVIVMPRHAPKPATAAA